MSRARDLADSASVVDPLDGLYGSSSSPIIITVKVATKTASHPYNGDGSSSGYTLNNVESPAIKFGGTDAATSSTEYVYRFDQADSSNSGHPLRFYLDAAKATAFTTGVTTNGTAGSAGAYTQIAVDSETPKILYYQCSSHAYMGNYATVSGSLSFSAGSLRIADTAVTSTGAEINKLDALSRGSLIYGNASAATAILTKGSANQVLTSDGTDIAWADAAAGGTNGWQLISTTTVSSSPSTVDITSGINSTYDNYVLVISNLTMGSPDSCYVMWYKASSLISGSTYDYTEVGSSVTNRTNQSAITIAAPTPAGSSVNGNFFLFNANSTVARGAGYLAQTQRADEMQFASGSSNNSGAVTGIRIRTEVSSTFTTGTFRLYGIAQS